MNKNKITFDFNNSLVITTIIALLSYYTKFIDVHGLIVAIEIIILMNIKVDINIYDFKDIKQWDEFFMSKYLEKTKFKCTTVEEALNFREDIFYLINNAIATKRGIVINLDGYMGAYSSLFLRESLGKLACYYKIDTIRKYVRITCQDEPGLPLRIDDMILEQCSNKNERVKNYGKDNID